MKHNAPECTRDGQLILREFLDGYLESWIEDPMTYVELKDWMCEHVYSRLCVLKPYEDRPYWGRVLLPVFWGLTLFFLGVWVDGWL